MKKLTAYCYRSGQIKFTNAKRIPKGAIRIISGNPKLVREKVEVCARWSYPTVRGGNDSVPLVPGIPEANSDEAAESALHKFIEAVEARIETKHPAPKSRHSPLVTNH